MTKLIVYWLVNRILDNNDTTQNQILQLLGQNYPFVNFTLYNPRLLYLHITSVNSTFSTKNVLILKK